MKASIAQWQSVGLVNQRSWVQSSLEANDFCKRRQAKYIFLVGPPPFNNFDGVGKQKSFMTPTWFEHAAFWSGVRRATVAPRSHNDKRVKKIGSTEIWTRIAGFKVQSANHYTIEPWLVSQIFKVGKDHKCLSHSMYSVNFVFGVQISYFADIISGLSWGKYDIWTRKK